MNTQIRIEKVWIFLRDLLSLFSLMLCCTTCIYPSTCLSILQESFPRWLIRSFSWRSYGPPQFQEKTLLPTLFSITTRWCICLPPSELLYWCVLSCYRVYFHLSSWPSLSWGGNADRDAATALVWTLLKTCVSKLRELLLPSDVSTSWSYLVN